MFIIMCTGSVFISSDAVSLHSSDTANDMEQSLREEEERAAVEKQVQLLEQRLSGELASHVYSTPCSVNHTCIHMSVCGCVLILPCGKCSGECVS